MKIVIKKEKYLKYKSLVNVKETNKIEIIFPE